MAVNIIVGPACVRRMARGNVTGFGWLIGAGIWVAECDPEDLLGGSFNTHCKEGARWQEDEPRARRPCSAVVSLVSFLLVVTVGFDGLSQLALADPSTESQESEALLAFVREVQRENMVQYGKGTLRGHVQWSGRIKQKDKYVGTASTKARCDYKWNGEQALGMCELTEVRVVNGEGQSEISRRVRFLQEG